MPGKKRDRGLESPLCPYCKSAPRGPIGQAACADCRREQKRRSKIKAATREATASHRTHNPLSSVTIIEKLDDEHFDRETTKDIEELDIEREHENRISHLENTVRLLEKRISNLEHFRVFSTNPRSTSGNT